MMPASCEGPEPWDFAEGFLDSVLWNAMVVPLLRTVHSGVVWYQVCLILASSSPHPRLILA